MLFNNYKNKRMGTHEISINRVAIKSGIITFLGFVFYFILMMKLNLIQKTELRALNFVILLSGLFFSFKYYVAETKGGMEYLKGLLFGCTISAISILPFALFVGFYFALIDPHLLLLLRDNAPMMGIQLTPVIAAGTIVIEGMCSGVIISFFLIPYFQNDPSKS